MQMKPSVDFGTKKTTIPNNGSSEQITSQIWSKSGNCPKGTIPVRRVSREDKQSLFTVSFWEENSSQI